MKKAVAIVEPVSTTNEEVHPLQRSYTFVSDRHVDYNNLNAFEALSMSAVFVLAVMVGVTSTL